MKKAKKVVKKVVVGAAIGAAAGAVQGAVEAGSRSHRNRWDGNNHLEKNSDQSNREAGHKISVAPLTKQEGRSFKPRPLCFQYFITVAVLQLEEQGASPS